MAEALLIFAAFSLIPESSEEDDHDVAINDFKSFYLRKKGTSSISPQNSTKSLFIRV